LEYIKADLHIHTPYSSCYSETTATPQQIVDSALAAGLGVMAITDHNTFKAVDAIRDLAAPRGLTVFPGVELSTPGGHVLAIFDRDASTQHLAGLLPLLGLPESAEGDGTVITRDGIEEVFRKIVDFGGIAITAHIERWPSGFLETKEHRSTKMRIHASPYLSALEITQPQAKGLWNDGLVRGYPKKYPCLQGSDAHAPGEIGRRVTYFRFAPVSLEGLRLAFQRYQTWIAFPHELARAAVS